VEAGDRYVGLDLSFAMIREFATIFHPSIVQADALRMPFADATFDIVLVVQVLNGVSDWERFLAETVRVLDRGGTVVLGRAVNVSPGIEDRLRARLSEALEDFGVAGTARGTKSDRAVAWCERQAATSRSVIAARWTQMRTPREFLERKLTGHRFAALPASIQEAALTTTADWAISVFGSLDASEPEARVFELNLFTF
jgi:SAM-dependent methyltransferase